MDENRLKQKNIPVGCVPPACCPYPVVSDWGVSAQPPFLDADLPLHAEPPGHVTCVACWEVNSPPPPPRGQKEWHTLVKISPCSKLRLRTVKIAWIIFEREMLVRYSRVWWYQFLVLKFLRIPIESVENRMKTALQLRAKVVKCQCLD